ncbi:hypothetical protein [Amaricoccus sp.]|uniref:hypothetical protein n=1 Tax=Amaricoccus sp. TaxID=1872485 RepID=UPI001B4CB28B|nr:hypothetical protein [Amaricoccus sp.]MBP7001751.1 hypothetical protein [Amaricoccus sp.]
MTVKPDPDLYRPDLVATYEAGKGRRYGLLFSANGGAYAIAVYLAGFKHGFGGVSFDALGLIVLAAFMIVFNRTMWVDIFAFGMRMRDLDREMRNVPCDEKWLLFGAKGKAVLATFCVGLMLAWACVLVGGVLAATLGIDPQAAAPAAQ